MARPKNTDPSVPITRRIHPAYAERLAELESLGYDLEGLIAIANSVLMTLACTAPTEGKPEIDYQMGRLEEAAFLATTPGHVRETWLRDWRCRQYNGQQLTPLLTERREWIETHIARYRQLMVKSQLNLSQGGDSR